MRIPALFVSNNLIWSASGGVWALFRLHPTNYTYMSDKDKLKLLHKIKASLMAVPDESMVLSVCREIDPAAVAEQMLQQVNMARFPAWRKQVNQTVNKLESGPLLYDRYFYLAVELPDRNWAYAASASMINRFGLTAPPPSKNERELRASQASQYETKIGSGFSMRAATSAEIRWIYDRSIYRGLIEPEIAEQWSTSHHNGTDPVPDIADVGLISQFDAVFHEGGLKTDPNRPRLGRYVRIETEVGVSYQTNLMIAGMPAVWQYPNGGGEWWVAADYAPFPIDWCARITSVPNDKAQRGSRRQARQLKAQVDEYVGEPSGPPADLETAMEAIDAQRSELAASPTTPELRSSMIFSLASHDLEDLEHQAGAIRAMFEAWEYNMPRPTGGQRDLFTAMLPGSSTPQVARDYAQFLMPSDLASGMPIAGCRIGDPTGFVLGHTLDSGTHQPVLFDAGYGPANNSSGCVAAVGTLGAGKSYAIKSMAYGEVSKGSQVVVLDRTAKGEYVTFSEAVPGRKQVVELAPDANICIDPLAVFSGEDRAQYAIGFLTLLTGTPPTEPQGAVLAAAVEVVAARPDGRLIDVIEVLHQSDDEESHWLARKIEIYANSRLAHIAFGEGEAVRLDADFVVLWMPELRLPKRKQLENEHLAKQLLPEQIFSQAILYLVAALARDIIFSAERFSVGLFDESWALTASPQGMELLHDGIRDSRKHNAAIWMSSQDPNDIPPELSKHLGVRLAFQQGNDAGASALRFLGLKPTEEWVAMLENELETGQGLFKDVRGRVGKIQIASAATRQLEKALDTTPVRGAVKTDDFPSTRSRRRASVGTN